MWRLPPSQAKNPLIEGQRFPKNNVALRMSNLDGLNRARVISESLARVIAAIRITSVRWCD